MARKSGRNVARGRGPGGTPGASERVTSEGMGTWLRGVWGRPMARVGTAAAVVGCVGLVVGLVYVYGGGQPAAQRTGGTPVAAATLTPSGGQKVFTIAQSGTVASFTMHEVLFGKDNTVVGKTNQVTGQILVDLVAPAKTQVGTIRVDVSTLVTDNDMRNRTLQGRILETSDPSNMDATFVPKSYEGLPESASALSVGHAFAFKITGDLTVHQVTRAATFDVMVTPQSATALTGQAQTTVRYEDFGLVIPNVPFVADVSDNAVLTLTFAAHQ